MLTNLKEIIGELQNKNIYFQTQVKQLQTEKKQLILLNRNLSNKVNCLEENLKEKVFGELNCYFIKSQTIKNLTKIQIDFF